jgi:hypothetical protein
MISRNGDVDDGIIRRAPRLIGIDRDRHATNNAASNAVDNSEVYVTTNLKLILTAIGIAILASPATAQSEMARPHLEQPTDNISSAYRSVSHERNRLRAPPEPGISTARGSVDLAHNGNVNEGSKIRIDDCVRTPFPQCSDGG